MRALLVVLLVGQVGSASPPPLSPIARTPRARPPFLAAHPAGKDELVIERRVDTNGVLVERLTDAGISERRPPKLCEAGAEREVVQLARPGAGVRISRIASR